MQIKINFNSFNEFMGNELGTYNWISTAKYSIILVLSWGQLTMEIKIYLKSTHL